MLIDLAPSLPDAHIGQHEFSLEYHFKRLTTGFDGYTALFDIHSLWNDIHANPANYLNGTAPLNVTGAVKVCIYEVGTENNECTFYAEGSDRDSYLWYVRC